MAVVTTTIGTEAGRDYSTIGAWEADLEDSGIYSSGDDAVGECYNDSAFDEKVTIDGGKTVGLNSVTLSVASGERHDGTAGTGARIVLSGTTDNAIETDYTFTELAVTVEWLELDGNGNRMFPAVVLDSGTLTENSAVARNMLIHTSPVAAGIKADASPANVLNNIIYDLTLTGGATQVGVQAGGNGVSKVLNNTVHNISHDGSGDTFGFNMTDSAGNLYQNNIATDTSASGTVADYSDSSPVNATVDHNLSSDGTASGTGSLTNKASADQFVSTTVGAEDLHLKSGADAIDAGTDLGTTPPGVEIDIDGWDRNAEGDVWDMGADEFVAAGGATASVTPIVAQFALPTVTAESLLTAEPAPIVAEWSLPSVTATFVETADPAPLASAWSLPAVTATFVETADVSPVASEWAIPSVTAASVITANASPVAAEWSLPAVTATFTETAEPSPVAANWVIPTVTATGPEEGVASVQPVVSEWSITSVEAQSTIEATAAPVVAEWSLPAVTAQSTITAVVGPVASEWLLPAVEAVSVVTASASPIAAEWALVTPDATFVGEASVTPLVSTWSVVAVTATFVELASVAPLVGEWVLPSVTATTDEPVAVVGKRLTLEGTSRQLVSIEGTSEERLTVE